jgi:hypothetical protein
MRKTEFRTWREASELWRNPSESRDGADAGRAGSTGAAASIPTTRCRSEDLSGTIVGEAVGAASAERMAHSVSQAIMSADASEEPPLWSPCSQHGIEQIASAAQRGRTKNAPRNTSSPIPPSSFLPLEVRSCTDLDVEIITLGDNLVLRNIPRRDATRAVRVIPVT